MLAAMRCDVCGRQRSAVEAGKMLSSAPESTRKCLPEYRSKMEMVEDEYEGKPAVAIDDRPLRFPRTDGVKLGFFVETGPASDIWPTCRNKLVPRNERGVHTGPNQKDQKNQTQQTHQAWRRRRPPEVNHPDSQRRKPQQKTEKRSSGPVCRPA